jgi:hypothetical protein
MIGGTAFRAKLANKPRCHVSPVENDISVFAPKFAQFILGILVTENAHLWKNGAKSFDQNSTGITIPKTGTSRSHFLAFNVTQQENLGKCRSPRKSI